MLDLAWGTPPNDGWRDPAPRRGHIDGRAAEEQIDQVDAILDDDSAEPSIAEMRDLSNVPWGEGADPVEQRPVLVRVDKSGMEWRHLGGLEFIYGAMLWNYGDLSGDRRLLKKPTERRRPRRARRADASIATSSSGAWSLDDQIDARQRVRMIWKRMPASSVRILELALGSTKARELGEAFHKTGKAAERFGVKLIDRAIDHLRGAVPRLHAKHSI